VPIEADKLNLVADLTNESRYEIKLPNVTERSGLVTSRVGQGAYRKRIIHRWEYQCAVTGFNKLEVLIASHIMPWKDATDDERLDVDNGLLLSPTYDALFDRHLISFEKNGSIILSDKIELDAFKKIGITGKERLRLELNDGVKNYLDHHHGMMLGPS
jgi:predicted restriction endonuclease